MICFFFYIYIYINIIASDIKVNIQYILVQRLSTDGPWTTSGSQENLGGPEKNLNITYRIFLLLFPKKQNTLDMVLCR
jgi:hypothetical protein